MQHVASFGGQFGLGQLPLRCGRTHQQQRRGAQALEVGVIVGRGERPTGKLAAIGGVEVALLDAHVLPAEVQLPQPAP